MVGGVLASIQPKEIENATGIKPHCGTLHTPYKDIDDDNPYVIDELPLDYSILEEIDYEYVDGRAFLATQHVAVFVSVHFAQYRFWNHSFSHTSL